MDHRRVFYGAALALLMLCACSGDKDKVTLTGERLPLRDTTEQIKVDAQLASTEIVLPEAVANKDWPQKQAPAAHLTMGVKPKPAWRKSIGRGTDSRHLLTAQPVVADGIIYTLDTNSIVTARQLADGKEIWRLRVWPKSVRNYSGLGGGLVVQDDLVYVASGMPELLALGAKDGKLRWRVALNAPARTAPTVYGDKILVVTRDQQTTALSRQDGHLLWQYNGLAELTQLAISPSPLADDAGIIVQYPAGDLVSLQPENGLVAWQDNLKSAQAVQAQAEVVADTLAQPVADNDVVIASIMAGQTTAYARRLGEPIWQIPVALGSTPALAGDWVFMVSTDGRMLALSRKTGQIKWLTELSNKVKDEPDEMIRWQGPILAGGRLWLVNSQGNLATFDPQTGKEISHARLPGIPAMAPVVADGTMLILLQSGDLLALR